MDNIVLIDKEYFFYQYRKFFQKSIPQEQVDDLDFLIDKMDASKKITGENNTVLRARYAYIFATVYHETACTFDPISERGSRKYLMSKPYYPYYGRGYVQLTWASNYKRFGDFLGIDLLNQPWLANEPEIAWLVLEEGMTRNDAVPKSEDPNFTGYTLENFINTRKIDFRGARRVINGTDRARLIAGYAEEFSDCIQLIPPKLSIGTPVAL